MNKKARSIIIAIFISALIYGLPLFAQDNVTVPDVTGMSLPEASAALNKVGLAVGAETIERWTAESGREQNTISAQSVAPGTSAAPGTAVEITILRTPNALLIYDDNDLTVVNQAGNAFNLRNIRFEALNGSGASFAANRWGDSLRADQCVQVWSVGRNGPKGLDECSTIQNWLVTTNGGEHFWTGAGGITQFAVIQNDVQRAVCMVGNPGRCEMFLSVGNVVPDETTDYVYFAYLADRLAIINTSTDKWMPVGNLVVRNNAVQPFGAIVNVGNAELFGNPQIVGRIGRLAPGQCLLFTNSSDEAQTPPQPCDVIAKLDVGPSVIFWAADFPVESVTDDAERNCPAAVPDRLTLCIMPR
jgi:PASTA domain